MNKDVVCGMQVDAKKAKDKSRYEGKEYVFCSPECKSKFDQKPEAYVGKAAQATW